jgi:hypothetical protein
MLLSCRTIIRMKKNITYLLVIFFMISCQPDSNQPETPEEVLKLYQQYIDNNQFEEAKTLSTEAGKEWLSELAAIIVDEQPDSTILTTRFLSVNCTEKERMLICECELEDQYEKYTAEFRLVKVEGRWMVDAPEEDIIIENDIIEAMPDSLLDAILEGEQVNE